MPAAAQAYDPPDDTVGPLQVHIDGPSEVTDVGKPLRFQVTLTNNGDDLLTGTIRIGLIDRWKVRPKTPIPFEASPHTTIRYPFQVRVGQGTYNGHYPVHVFARFVDNGQQRIAHPILILETKLTGQRHPTADIPSQPLKLSSDSGLALWQTPVRRAIVQVFGEKPTSLPVGFEGVEPGSRATVSLHQQVLAGVENQVVALHPPWYDGHAGTVAVEYPVLLSNSGPIQLAFANAMNPDGQSDGVTFRVRVAAFDAPEGTLGAVEYERHTQAKTWQEATVDLSKYAGQAIRLQLESHPGPKGDTGWDYSFWAEPTLTAGSPPSSGPKKPLDDAISHLLGTTECGGQRYEIRFWPGSRGLLDGVVRISDGSHQLEAQGFEVTVLGSRIDDPRSPVRLIRVTRTEATGGLQLRHFFDSAQGPFELVAWIGIEKNVLRTRLHIENAPTPRPWFDLHLDSASVARWNDALSKVYAGVGNVLSKPGAYRLGFDGHRLATSFVGYDFEQGISLVEGVDAPPKYLEVRPERQHASLHVSDTQTRTLIPTPDVWEGVKQWRKVNGLKAAGGVSRTAGRFVFDLWSGRYGETKTQLQRAFRYGLTDSMVVWHNWQRWGYDYRLPEIYPPNPRFGATDELRDLIASCRKAGVLFALHDNYIDFYPDAKGFSYKQTIAFHQDGTPVRAWFNRGRDASSYRYRSDRAGPFLKNNLRKIHDKLTPSAYFVDVWSSARPYEYWTSRGDYWTATSSRDTWRALFAWARNFMGNNAPQISESGHDQLIGWLDGAQTNHMRVGPPPPDNHGYSEFAWDWDCTDAERIPWYDAAHHDRFALHGAGYERRYAAGLDPLKHGMYSDDYLATEVLTGHPAMVSRPFGRDVVRKYWLTHELMRALAGRRIESVEFVGDDIHRQHVRWSGGADVWVNRGREPWRVEDVQLPQYGFLARVPCQDGDIVVSVQQPGGTIIESAQSANQWYVNGRAKPDRPATVPKIRWEGSTIGGGCRLAPDGDRLFITPLPNSLQPRFDVAIDWKSLPWKLPMPTHVEAINEQGKVVKRSPIRRDGDRFVVRCTDDAFAFRLTQAPKATE